MMATVQDYSVLANNPGFTDIEQPVVEQLVSLAQVVELKAGESLYNQGQLPTAFYAVLDGTMRLGLTTPEGREFVLAYMSHGLIFGESGFFDHLPMHHGAMALTDVRLLIFPNKPIQALLDKQPILYRPLSLLQARRTRIVTEMLTGFSRDGFERRLARRLLLLAKTYGETVEQGISLQIAQEELGAMLGVTRQSVYKVLKRWEDSDCVKLEYGALILLDLTALETLATM